MKKLNRESFEKTLLGMEEGVRQVDALNINQLDQRSTAVVIIDMINGFVREGALQSPRAEEIIPYLASLLQKFEGYTKLFVADTHEADAVEFGSYPPHALVGSSESKIVKELVPYQTAHSLLIQKNSTNAFVSKDFQSFLQAHPEINNYVVVGVCTDICVMQFALSLKTYFNEINQRARVIVPTDGVETFDLEITCHNGDLMNLFSLYTMKANGIELVADIQG